MVKTIKISDENYKWISVIAGKLQQEHGEPVSIDRALSYVHKSKELTDLAGSWKLPEKQIKKTHKDLKDRWATYVKEYLKQRMKVEKVCLDTDIIQEYLINKKEAVATIKKIQQTADCATTALTVFELFCVAEESEHPEENNAVIQEFIDRLTILQWNPIACKKAAKLFVELQKLKKKPDIRDVLVGVLAKQQNHTMVTTDKERYAWIPGLKLLTSKFETIYK
jgi:tRNA(fMet)-specific endonuclease VapC